MNLSLLLRLHRWITLTFALPLLAVILTGLILSFEPVVQWSGTSSHPLDTARVVDLVKQYDPEGKARGVSINAAAQRLTLQGASAPAIDLATGEPATASSNLADLLLWARRTHERLLGQSWLVISSTVAMIGIISLGVLMGLPRLRNSLAGWHKGSAWFSLPLILLSPLTGLCMAMGLTFQASSAPTTRSPPVPLIDAIRIVGKSHDLALVTSIGIRGGRLMVRMFDGSELRAYTIAGGELVALPRNWPRAIHEGNWSAVVASLLNIVVSVVLLALVTTGLLLWTRRKWRQLPGRTAKRPGVEVSAEIAAR